MDTTPRKTCPNCTKQPTETYSPFCSKRCADLDLGNWLNGNYYLPGQSPLTQIDEED